MRLLVLAAGVTLLAASAWAQSDAEAPRGRLSDAATPSAYRLDLTILPDQSRFSGHVEIDVTVKVPTRRLYLHGRDLRVTRAEARTDGAALPATWTQVDPTGVVRLDFATPLPAGRTTLAFDYTGAIGDTPSGLYRTQVAGRWYSWTQFESIDARAAFPSFDEPGFKTPFDISVTTQPGLVAVSNAPEIGLSRNGALETHRFATTKPLPTYLVAFDTGPFLHPATTIAPDAQRATPLPLGAVAAQAQAGKLDYVLAETPRIVTLLEGYFGRPFPFPKLDQIASPQMPGAMENAGADTYADEIILLDPGAAVEQRREFGMVVAHELSHQWFGDLVSPAWWDDIWLNESFANWMGFRIGDAWRPELNIGVGALAEGFGAMNTDALEVGRPIHQPIATNAEIDSAFDTITYGKGGQVVAMIAAYMGDEAFKQGVRLHMSRHAYGNATTEQFFASLADAAHDPRVVAAMKSFVDQPGAPLLTFTREGPSLRVTQSRYAFLGGTPQAERWTIPFCLHVGAQRPCALLDRPSLAMTAPTGGVLMPNAGGAGYYRFELPDADWRALIADLPDLSPAEATATDDSLWASFRAGRAPPGRLIEEARSLLGNPDGDTRVMAGERLAGLRRRGLIEGEALVDYRRVMTGLYAPGLRELGFDPGTGAYAADDLNRRRRRATLVGLVAQEARAPDVRARLAAAAQAYLAGDLKALDQEMMSDAFVVYAQQGGVAGARRLVEAALATENSVLRREALRAAARAGRTDVADWLLSFADARLRPTERLGLVFGLAATPETRDLAADWLLDHYDQVAGGAAGIFLASRLPSAFGVQCSADRAARIESVLGPKVKALGRGELDFARTVESIRHCADLKHAREADLATALRRAS